jgi:hypothetical protein
LGGRGAADVRGAGAADVACAAALVAGVFDSARPPPHAATMPPRRSGKATPATQLRWIDMMDLLLPRTSPPVLMRPSRAECSAHAATADAAGLPRRRQVAPDTGELAAQYRHARVHKAAVLVVAIRHAGANAPLRDNRAEAFAAFIRHGRANAPLLDYLAEAFAAFKRARSFDAYPSLLSCFARPMASASGGTSLVTVVPVAT